MATTIGELKAIDSALLDSEHACAHFSQLGEDVVIDHIFRYLIRAASNFYVDVGCHHPFRYSNTILLHKRGWRGINIDADPDSIALFRKERPLDININLGVADSACAIEFHRLGGGARSTFSVEEKEKAIASGEAYHGSFAVECLPLTEILRRHVPHNTTIDLLNVDIEGYDLAAVRSLDFGQFRPTVVAIEDFGIDFRDPMRSSIFKTMDENGYRLVSHVICTSVYMRC